MNKPACLSHGECGELPFSMVLAFTSVCPGASILMVIKLGSWCLFLSIITEMHIQLLFDYHIGDFFQLLLLCNYLSQNVWLKSRPLYCMHELISTIAAITAGLAPLLRHVWHLL